MRLGWTISIILLVMMGITLGVYYFKERPIQEEENVFVTLNIGAKENGEFIKTGYEIYLDGNLHEEGNTSQNTYISRQVGINHTIAIFNKNLEQQNYYQDIYESQVYGSQNKELRVDLSLTNPGEIELTKRSNPKYDVRYLVEKEGLFKNLILCYSWGVHTLVTKSPELNETSRINNESKCYIAPLEQSFDLEIDYLNFGDLEKYDFINLTFYDFEVNPVTGFENPIKIKQKKILNT